MSAGAKIYYHEIPEYKYFLHQDYVHTLEVSVRRLGIQDKPLKFPAKKAFIEIGTDGILKIRKKYAWDGATLFPDYKSILRASMIHDALYQLMREGVLPQSARAAADAELRKACGVDGMPLFGRWVVWLGVRLFGGTFARKNLRKGGEMVAP